MTLIGAGQGNDPASNTILQGTGDHSVVRIGTGTVSTVIFQNLRITGGGGGPGGGIQNGDGHILALVDCTITGNNISGPSGAGGGIFTGTGSRLSLTGCTITRDSTAILAGASRISRGE